MFFFLSYNLTNDIISFFVILNLFLLTHQKIFKTCKYFLNHCLKIFSNKLISFINPTGHIRHQQPASTPIYPPAATPFHGASAAYAPFYTPGGCFPTTADMSRFTAPGHPSFSHFPTLHDH